MGGACLPCVGWHRCGDACPPERSRHRELLLSFLAGAFRLNKVQAPFSTFGGAAGHGAGAPLPGNGLATDTTSHTTPAEDVTGTSASSHPTGWFKGKLPSFGTCGGRRGSLSEIWEVWGGAGPGKVTGGGSGFSLRAHGETSVKEQEQWGSTSNYGRYLQAGRYMDKKIASIKENKGCSDQEATKEMLFQVAREKGTETVTTWFSEFVAGGKGKKRSRDVDVGGGARQVA